MINVSDKIYRENHNIHFMLNSYFSCNSSRYKPVEKCNRAKEATDNGNILVIRCMRFACWVTKAKNKYSEYVILIAFHGNSVYMNASRYVYISCVAFTVYAAFGTYRKLYLFYLSLHTSKLAFIKIPYD
jgi:hypothetical protein